MSTSELLGRLKGLGVRLWREGVELRLSAPKGVLTDALRAELAARKQELLEALASAEHDAGALPPARANGAPAGSGPLSRAPGGEIPLSFTQQRLWFLQQLDPALTAYNIPLSWLVRGALDAAALERALGALVERHEVLRTVFPPRDGRPRQEVLPAWDAPWQRWTNERSLPDREWRAEVRARLEALAREPFDLARGPLLRPVLARLTPEEHVLFVAVHHIVFDGASIDLFLRELCADYRAFAAGQPSAVAPPPMQYGDFARWQADRMRGPELERLLAFWRTELAGDLPVLELPLDRPRPPVQTYAGAKCSRALPSALVRELERLARAQGATLFMALLCVYQALLARTTGREDVIVATPIAGRHVEGVERMIGFFANTLVLRTRTHGRPSFRELLGRVRDACLGAFEHQDMPFERLVDELAPRRTLSHTPLFQTMFLIEEAGGRSAADEPPSFEPYELTTHVARTDLMVYAYRTDAGWSLWAEYNTDLFDGGTIERLLGHYVELCGSAVSDPERPIGELELLCAPEREALLVGWNRRGEPFPERAVHRRFQEQVERTPAALAVLFPALDDPARDERLSYRELERRANRLAHHLIARGVRPGALVGVCVERSSAMLVALLAILETGAAYVPLDPSYPAERLLYMAGDARLSLVVTHGELDRLFAPLIERGVDSGALALCHLEREADLIAACSPERTGVAVGARERMYVIYTSGSTGKPKGVEIEHRSVSNFLSSMQREPGLAQGELFLALTTPSFDISVLELFGPLLCGAAVAIAPAAATADGAALSRLLERLRPDVLQATPASWRLLLLAGWQGAPQTLRAYSGGEALTRELADELCARTRSLWNLYGPTEATIWSTVERVEPGLGPISIGRPIANTRVYVLDQSLRPVPIGVTGELWIAGDGLARGYLERPELDAERFVPDPFMPGERMYKTGDLARWRACADGGGELECLGRVDHQVKLRGFRIELGEVESVLALVEGVRECVAIVREDTPGDQRLVAYYTRGPGAAAVEPAALRAAARARLPVYMLPALFQELEALPLTPNGKVDRKALFALETQAPALEHEHVPPRNATEETIARVWSQVLGLEQITVNTNFFDLGGHSLLLAQVHARLLQHFPALGILELFQFPTVSALAEHVDAPPPSQAGARGRSLSDGRAALLQRRRIRR